MVDKAVRKGLHEKVTFKLKSEGVIHRGLERWRDTELYK